VDSRKNYTGLIQILCLVIAEQVIQRDGAGVLTPRVQVPQVGDEGGVEPFDGRFVRHVHIDHGRKGVGNVRHDIGMIEALGQLGDGLAQGR